MKVDEPVFGRLIRSPEVRECDHCPLEEYKDLCTRWLKEHNWTCPKANTYDEACLMAEEAKGGKG